MNAIYAGSFDPPTLGHIDIIRQIQAMNMFKEVHVIVAKNVTKGKRLLPAETSADLIRSITGVYTEVLENDRYVADVVSRRYASKAILVRGLRDASDMGPEIAIRRANSAICLELQTIYLLASPEVSHISSTAVRSLVGFKGWMRVVGQYVPHEVLMSLADNEEGKT